MEELSERIGGEGKDRPHIYYSAQPSPSECDESRIITKSLERSEISNISLVNPAAQVPKAWFHLLHFIHGSSLWDLWILSAPEHTENSTAGFLTVCFIVCEPVAFQSLIIFSKLTLFS